ncbi:MAG: hypothetical protein ACYS1E_12105 [Planctomycetota bacterium]|jgi:hypothetical protein
MNRRLLVPGLVPLAALVGCAAGGTSGSLLAESLGTDPVVLPRDYVSAFYAVHDDTVTSFFLADVPLDELLSGKMTRGNVVHLDLLWVPKAGNTPMDSSATNVSIRFVVFADGEVGVYGGAGFALPDGPAGASTMTLELRDASLTLLDSTDGFIDLLSPARLTGTVTARLSEKRVRQLRYAVSQLVTDALGRSSFVRGEPVREPRVVIARSRPIRSEPSAWRPSDR